MCHRNVTNTFISIQYRRKVVKIGIKTRADRLKERSGRGYFEVLQMLFRVHISKNEYYIYSLLLVYDYDHDQISRSSIIRVSQHSIGPMVGQVSSYRALTTYAISQRVSIRPIDISDLQSHYTDALSLSIQCPCFSNKDFDDVSPFKKTPLFNFTRREPRGLDTKYIEQLSHVCK